MTQTTNQTENSAMQSLCNLLPISPALWKANGAEDGEQVLSVNARDLHRALDIGRDFSNWIKARLSQAQFIEHQDFEIVENLSFDSPKWGNQNDENLSIDLPNLASANNEQFTPNLAKNKKGRPNQDYWLSLDTAKHICLMERKNPIAHAIRQHFIDSEKELNRIAPITAKDLRQRTKLRIASIAPQERLNTAIQQWAKRNGKEDRAHHYSNEAEMINSIVLGMNARLWKQAHDISDCPRNHFNAEQLDLLNSLLEADVTLLNIDLAFSTRKEKLTELAARKLLARIA